MRLGAGSKRVGLDSLWEEERAGCGRAAESGRQRGKEIGHARRGVARGRGEELRGDATRAGHVTVVMLLVPSGAEKVDEEWRLLPRDAKVDES